MNILCIGDIVGKPGRAALVGLLAQLKEEFSIDCTIVNAENSAGGAGITERIAKHLFEIGCDVLTLGDHVWDQKDIEAYLPTEPRLIRPANFPEGAPGCGYTIVELPTGIKVGVINLLGRIFMRHQVECPFRAVERLILEIQKQTPVIVIDMHAEATSEKVAMGHYADGKASVVFGTHTHVQTADEQVLANGTAYITDLGMTGPYDSVIGQTKEQIIQRFLTSMPIRFKVAETNSIKLCGIVISVDEATGKAKTITRIQRSFLQQT